MKHCLKLHVLTASLLLAACATGPDYKRPELNLPPQFNATNHAQANVPNQWWTLYKDETLNGLVRQALEKNADLRIAMSRVDEAAAVLKETGAVRFPEIDLNGAAGRSRISTLSNPPVPASYAVSNNNRIALSTAFELDVWGKLRRANEAAQAQYLATSYARDTVALALAGTTAQAYFSLRSLDAQIVVTQQSLKTRQESLALVQKRFDSGYSSSLDVSQSQAAVAAANAQLADLQRQRGLVQNQLNNLIAQPGSAIASGDIRQLPIPVAVPVGIPSTLLERRPDVQQAEQALIASNAQIGVAKTAMLPSLSLSSNLGGQSAELGDLLKSGARIWSLGFGLALPLFDFGKNAARVEQTEARQQQAVGGYQKAAENAFREVADALVSNETLMTQEAALQAQAEAAQKALQLSNKRYAAGYSAYLEVLDAQRSVNDAELGLVRARQARLAASVDLMKALGGGWTSNASITNASKP